MRPNNRLREAFRDAKEYFKNIYSAILDKYIMNPTVIRGLDSIGLTNLTDEQVDRHVLLYATQEHSIADKVLTPKVMRFMHNVGLTNLTDEEVGRYSN